MASSAPQERRCKDCEVEGVVRHRPAPHPGPRCATHHRQWRKRGKTKAHDRHVQATYGITADQYAAILAHQGGRCAICQRATGATKRMAVDHDHRRGCGHDPSVGCPNCVRGIACGPCNQMIGHGRDDPEFFGRVIRYLLFPPAREVLDGGTV